jgi:hypothetical protein
MMYRLVIFLLLSIAMNAYSEVKEFTRDYTYRASDNDSKVSARKAAMQQLQSLVIQEVGVQVKSSFTNQETLNNDEFTRQVQVNYQSFSQALTKTKILEQSWNGEQFYLKALITVDTDNLIDRIKTIYMPSKYIGSSPPNPCKARMERVVRLLDEVRTEAILREITSISKANDFDRGCNNWQYSIMRIYASDRTTDSEYRNHLFSSLSNLESNALAGELMIDVVRYALSIRPLSDHEWIVVKDAIYRGKQSATINLIKLLIKNTQTNMVFNNEEDKSNEARKLTVKELGKRMMELTLSASQLNISHNKPMSEEDVAFYMVLNSMLIQPEFSKKYFLKYFPKFDKRQHQQLAKIVSNRYRQYPDEDSYNILTNYVGWVEITRPIAATMYQLFVTMKKNPEAGDGYGDRLENLIKWKQEPVSKIIELARTSKKNKNIWMIEYDIPSEGICKVEQCAQDLFSKKKAEVEVAADYLLAYGKNAVAVKDKVLKKLERLKSLKKVSNDTRLVPKLLAILGNIQASDSKSISLMVWALSDVSKSINQQAMASLEQVGYKSLPMLEVLFAQQKSTSQRRMVEVIATFKQEKQQSIQFLASIKPSGDRVKFAIEDALEALNFR